MWYKTKGEALQEGYLHLAKDINDRGMKAYTRVKTYDDISRIIDEEECVYEIVTGEWKEMYDFDGKDIAEDADVIIANFISCHQQISPEPVHVKRCISPSSTRENAPSSHGKLSLHFVVPNTVLPDRHAMLRRFKLMMDVPGLLHPECYDRSIYTKDRLIRTVRSDKCFQGRPFVSTSEDKDLFVSLPMKKREAEQVSQTTVLDKIIHKYNLTSFKPHSEIQPNVFRIARINPSFCIVCHRVHDNDNAFIDIDKLTYGCFRDPGNIIKLDSDIIRVSRSRLVTQLREFNIAPVDIDNIISRSSLMF